MQPDIESQISPDTGFDIDSLLDIRQQDKHALYAQYLNSKKVRSARHMGFERQFTRAEGCSLFDDAGREYLDLDAGNAVFSVGRNHPLLRSTIESLLQRSPANWVTRDTPLLAGLLGEALAAQLPGDLNKFMFTNTGSETVEAALKFARRLTGRTGFAYLECDFHGLSYGALSVTGGDSRSELMGHGFGPMLPGCQALPWGDIEALQQALQAEDVAALIIEPIQGASVKTLSGEYLQRAQALCNQHGSLLIVDEILTGLGRSGKFLAVDHHQLTPDLVLFAKGLGGGLLPLGALAIRQPHFHKLIEQQGAFVHGSTFGENDYSLAAGLATLSIIAEQNLSDRCAQLGQYFREGLEELRERHSMIQEIRGRGLLIGLQLQADRHWLRQPVAKLLHKKGLLGHLIGMCMVEQHGVICSVPMRNNVLRLHPPMLIERAQIDRCLQALDAVFKAAERFPDGVGQLISKRLIDEYCQ
jgi:ornithine--oxo-acid transaminase